MKYIITLDHCGSADCAMMINDKEYLIESDEWLIISTFWNIGKQSMTKLGLSEIGQKVLKTIYNA